MDTRTTVMEAMRQAIEAELPAAIELRSRLHAEPEVSGAEWRTVERVADAIGLGEGATVAETGRAIRVGSPTGPCIAVRAELDALPITEHTGATDASTNGAMHACGHDVHLAAATALARAAAAVELPVPLLVILQPREEGAPSGARDIIDERLLQEHDVRAAVAAHVQPVLARGVVAATEGAVNALNDELDILVTGRGGHGGYPHLASDPVLAIAQVIVALQQVISRRLDPLHPAVLSIGAVHAGSARNVIPEEAHARGNLRLLDVADRAAAHEQITTIVQQTAAAYGCRGDVSIREAMPALVNDPPLTAATHPWLTELGFEVSAPLRSCGADDFGYYSEVTRSLMMFVGVEQSPGGRDPGGGGEALPLHHPRFRPSDDAVRDVALALLAGYLAAADASIGRERGTDGP